MDETNLSNLSCQLTEEQDIVIDSVLGATGAFSCLSCLFALLLVFLFQKYRTSTQRVIVYLTVAVLLSSVVQILHVAGDKGNNIFIYCTITGFLDQYIGWTVLMAITCLTFDLFYKVLFKRQTSVAVEKAYVLLIFVSPILHSWIPFISNAYGIAGAWCWIRKYNEDCSLFVFGLILQFALYWIPLYIIAICILVAYVIARVKASIRLDVYRGKFDPTERTNKERLLKEVRKYQFYPLIFLIVNLPPLVNRIAEGIVNEQTLLVLGILHAFFIGLQGALITLAFALDSDTRKHLNWTNVKSAFIRLCSCKKQENINSYPVCESRSDSLRRSFLTEKQRSTSSGSVNHLVIKRESETEL